MSYNFSTALLVYPPRRHRTARAAAPSHSPTAEDPVQILQDHSSATTIPGSTALPPQSPTPVPDYIDGLYDQDDDDRSSVFTSHSVDSSSRSNATESSSTGGSVTLGNATMRDARRWYPYLNETQGLQDNTASTGVVGNPTVPELLSNVAIALDFGDKKIRVTHKSSPQACNVCRRKRSTVTPVAGEVEQREETVQVEQAEVEQAAQGVQVEQPEQEQAVPRSALDFCISRLDPHGHLAQCAKCHHQKKPCTTRYTSNPGSETNRVGFVEVRTQYDDVLLVAHCLKLEPPTKKFPNPPTSTKKRKPRTEDGNVELEAKRAKR